MKTVGQVLKNTRLKKGLSLSTIAHHLKTKPAYLSALEENNFSRLPSPTLVKGLLQRYAAYLDLDSQTILALFRRDFKITETGNIFPYRRTFSSSSFFLSFSPFTLLIIGFFFGFLFFLGFQLYNYLSLPQVTLNEPLNGKTYLSPVPVLGHTDPHNSVLINGQPILVSSSGKFSFSLPFTPGTHSLVIQVTSPASKTRFLQRTFEVVEK